MNRSFLVKFLVLPLLLILLVGCEPISVSINSKGEIAFTRSEGVFFLDLKAKKLTTLYWNYGKDDVPIIVRWSPDEKMLAYTIKDSSSQTRIFLVDRKGKNREEVMSTGKILTQLEWGPDGKYLSYAQQGEDTGLSVADLGIIELKTKRGAIFAKSAGDLHRWIDNNRLVFMKVNVKNENNTNMYKGELSLYDVNSNKSESLLPVIIDKSGGFDSNDKMVIFTAYAVEDREFGDDLSKSYPYVYHFGSEGADQLAQVPAYFLQISPDGKSVAAIVEENYEKRLAIIDNKSAKMTIILPKIADKVSANSAEVTVYPAWFGNEGVVYFKMNNVYGSNGQSLQLRLVDVKSKERDNLQPLIDGLIDKEVRGQGGY